MILRVCGIDVGLSSAAAAVYGYPGTNNRKTGLGLMAVWAIPTIGEGPSKRIDVIKFRKWLEYLKPDICYVETGTIRSGQASMSKFMRACGQIEATVTLSGIDGILVAPQKWKAAVVLRKSDKNESVRLAREVFPERAKTTFKFFHSHNIAEAALLPLYRASPCDLVKLQFAA